jgi:hypothetical protein
MKLHISKYLEKSRPDEHSHQDFTIACAQAVAVQKIPSLAQQTVSVTNLFVGKSTRYRMFLWSSVVRVGQYFGRQSEGAIGLISSIAAQSGVQILTGVKA